MSKEKRRIIYIICWTIFLAGIFGLGLLTFGYEDASKDAEDWNKVLAAMMLGIPGAMMILDMAYFFRFEKYYSAVTFVVVNFFMVFGITFVIEGALILIHFGIEKPQVKLFIFALAFSAITAVLNLFQSCFLGLAMNGRKKKHYNPNKK